MNENLPIHLMGEIYLLPPYMQERSRLASNTNFRALARFTSDFSLAFTIVVNFSPDLMKDRQCHRVRLNLAFAKWSDIEKLSHNSEVLIMDSYKVIAVCRNLTVVEPNAGKMGDNWLD